MANFKEELAQQFAESHRLEEEIMKQLDALQFNANIETMSENLTIIDKDYTQWVKDLSERYRKSQVKAAVKVNREMIRYYWELGRDIEEMHVEERWGESVIKNLSIDLKQKNPNATGLSRTNIYYAKKFCLLYSEYLKKSHKLWDKLKTQVCHSHNPQKLTHKLWDNLNRYCFQCLGGIIDACRAQQLPVPGVECE